VTGNGFIIGGKMADDIKQHLKVTGYDLIVLAESDR
jgi:hypothetical protein